MTASSRFYEMVLDDDERQSRRQMCFVPAHLITAWLGCAVVCGSRAQERHTLHGPPSLADEHLTDHRLWPVDKGYSAGHGIPASPGPRPRCITACRARLGISPMIPLLCPLALSLQLWPRAPANTCCVAYSPPAPFRPCLPFLGRDLRAARHQGIVQSVCRGMPSAKMRGTHLSLV